MKKILFTIVLFLGCILGANAQKTYALIAGVSSYQNSQMDLSYTTVDAKSLVKVLKAQNYVTALVTSKYANTANLRKKLNALARAAKSGDRILFYFSGHGAPGCFCAYDGNFDYKEVVSILSQSKAKEIYCIVDACHSGSAQESANPNYGWATGSNIMFFMASRADEYSWENSWVGHGYFTKALIKALRGKADANGDKKVTVSEVFKYVYKDVTKRSGNGQHPQLIGPKGMYDRVLAKW